MSLIELGDRLQRLADAEPGSRSGIGNPKKPDRWWDGARWRCANDHVSTSLLGTAWGKVCLACYEPVWLTFPEDRDGPLRARQPSPYS